MLHNSKHALDYVCSCITPVTESKLDERRARVCVLFGSEESPGSAIT